MASNTLRMSGMNSGLDTESIVDALTLTTKNKINTQERKVLKLKAQQEAYRSIISSLTTFQNKYFDILNQNTYLKSPSLFNTYKSTLTNEAGTTVKGVSCTSNNYANGGTYNVKVDQVATQAYYSSTGTSGASVDLSGCSDADTTYMMKITVGSKTETITFAGGDEETVRQNINDQLDVFGKTTSGANIVSIGSDNKFATSDKTAVNSTAAVEYSSSMTLDMNNLKTGNNTFSVTIGGSTKTVTLSTVESNYFEEIFDEDGNIKDDADAEKVKLFNDVAANEYEKQVRNAYNDYEKLLTDTDKDDFALLVYQKACDDNYNKYFNIAKSSAAGKAYTDAIADGTISSDENDSNYQSFEDFEAAFSFDDADFQATDTYQAYLDNQPDAADYTYDNLTEDQKLNYYREELYPGATEEEFKASFTAADAADSLNKANIKNNLEALGFYTAKLEVSFNDDGTAVISGKSTTTEGADASFAITASAANASDFGIAITDTTGTSSQISTSTTLDELGLTPDENGNYSFSINGTSFSFSGDKTIREMMRSVNASGCGATMSFTTLTNTFKITSAEYGINGKIDFEDGGEGLLGALGFSDSSAFTAGTNTILNINGVDIETESNSYTVDGTTFTFTQSAAGTEFTNVVERDYSEAINAIKSFVEDYNALIKEVYGYIDDEPDSDYYFLTDNDKEDMDLSESQEEKWEKMAKKGLLYNDSTLSSVMSKLRTAMYGTVNTADGGTISIFNIGISSSSNWQEHGKLTVDEKALTEAFSKYADEISTLFTDSTNGIMTQIDNVLDSAVKTTGARYEKGLLVQKAGVASTSSATDNAIYDELKRLQSLIDTLNDRYEKQQDRYWTIYSNLETQIGNLNSQTSSLSSLMGS